MDAKLLEEIELNFVPSKKDCEVDQEIVNIIYKKLKELSRCFPEETWEVIHRCDIIIKLENIDGCYFPLENFKEYWILLFYDITNPKTTEELVKVLLHELAHIYLKHKGRGSPLQEARQEKETESLTTKWYNAYYLAKNDPLHNP